MGSKRAGPLGETWPVVATTKFETACCFPLLCAAGGNAIATNKVFLREMGVA